MGSSLCHTAFHIRHNKMKTSFGLVQGKFNVDLQNLQVWAHMQQREGHLSAMVNYPFLMLLTGWAMLVQEHHSLTLSKVLLHIHKKTVLPLGDLPSPCFQSSEGTLMTSSPCPASGSTALTAAV